MAINSWDKGLREENESLKQQLMIAGKGGSPGQPYDDPEKGKGPFVPAPGKGKLAGLRINPNTILLPKEPKEPETDEDYGEGEVGDGWKLSHGEGRGPQPKYHDEYNQPLKFPPWMHINPSGEQIEIPWQKEDYLKEHPNLKISGATSRQIRDKLKPYTRGGPADYDKEGGSLRNLPASLRIKLLKA